MEVCYKKLWKLLIDRDLKKIDLQEKAGLSHYTINQLNKGCNVSTETLGKICRALDCKVEDIMEFVKEEQ